MSHCGYIQTFVRTELVSCIERCTVQHGFGVTIEFKTEGRPLFVSNVHLAPYKQNADKRLQMAQQLKSFAEGGDLIVLGDTNMRRSEESSWREHLTLSFDETPPVTWDSYRNRFHGPGAFSFRCSFSRCLHSAGIHTQNIGALKEACSVGSNSFFISDHFALHGTFVTSASLPHDS